MASDDTRFYVDPEVGPRGCTLHATARETATVSFFMPLVGRDYRPGAPDGEFRAAQDKRHTVPLDSLHEKREDAEQAAIALKLARHA